MSLRSGGYELVVNFVVEGAVLPVTGGTTRTETLPLWLGVAGLLLIALGLGLRRAFSRAR